MGPIGPIGLMGWKVAARIFHSLSGESQGKTHRISRIRSSLFCLLKKGIRRCLSAKPWLMRRYWRNACIVSEGGELKLAHRTNSRRGLNTRSRLLPASCVRVPCGWGGYRALVGGSYRVRRGVIWLARDWAWALVASFREREMFIVAAMGSFRRSANLLNSLSLTPFAQV